jgi:hypothetical protein
MYSVNPASPAHLGVRRLAAAFSSRSLLRRSQHGESISAQASQQILDVPARTQEAALQHFRSRAGITRHK